MSPIPSRVYNAAVGGHVCGSEDVDFGQKVVHLVKYDKAGNEVSFESQLTQTNKIYVIHDDFVLSNNVTIPSDCVLDFEGGSIIGAAGCTLTMNNCYLKGLPKFNNVIFAGDIKNSMFDATWIENGNDIGAKLNYAQQYFKRLCTPNRKFDLSTPVVLTGMRAVNLDSVFTYTGTLTNLNAAINIEKSANLFIYLNELNIDPHRNEINYSDNRSIHFIGLAITSCNDCHITFNAIAWFNENLRMQDIYGLGCSYNNIEGNYLCGGNYNLRFYQHNGPNGISWCNQTVVRINRITLPGLSKPRGACYAVVIGGPAIDLSSYKLAYPDSNDSSGNITIEYTSMEQNWTMIYARNITTLRVEKCREEGATCLMKCSGNTAIDYIKGYTIPPKLLDVSEDNSSGRINTNYYKSLSYKLNAPLGSVISYPENCIFCRTSIDGKSLLVDIDKATYATYSASYYQLSVGYIIDTSTNKYFWFDRNVMATYLNDAGNAVINNLFDYPKPSPSASFYNSYQMYQYVRYIKVPDGVNKIFVAVSINNNSYDFTVYSCYAFNVIKREIPLYGTTVERPLGINMGKTYFDTTLNKLLVCKNDVWSDVNGNPV